MCRNHVLNWDRALPPIPSSALSTPDGRDLSLSAADPPGAAATPAAPVSSSDAWTHCSIWPNRPGKPPVSAFSGLWNASQNPIHANPIRRIAIANTTDDPAGWAEPRLSAAMGAAAPSAPIVPPPAAPPPAASVARTVMMLPPCRARKGRWPGTPGPGRPPRYAHRTTAGTAQERRDWRSQVHDQHL